MLIFCDFIQVYVLTTNHHLKERSEKTRHSDLSQAERKFSFSVY